MSKSYIFIKAIQYLIGLFLFLSIEFVFSQNEIKEYSLPQFIDYYEVGANGTNSVTLFVSNPEKPVLKIKGHPFLNEKFTEGDMLIDNKIRVIKFPLRYNICTGQMQFMQNEEIYSIAYPKRVNEINISNKKFVYKDYFNNDKISDDYFEILISGKCSLFKRYSCKIIQGSYNAAMNVGDESKQYVKMNKYYLSIDNLPAELIKTSKKGVIKVLNSRKKELEEYIKSEKLKIKNEGDLKKLIIYYNSLM